MGLELEEFSTANDVLTKKQNYSLNRGDLRLKLYQSLKVQLDKLIDTKTSVDVNQGFFGFFYYILVGWF